MDFNEILADLSMQMDKMEDLVNEEREKTSSLEKRMDFTIKRMVKAENRLGDTDKRMIAFDEKLQMSIKMLIEAEQRAEAFDRKLEASIADQKKFSETQSKVNQYFLDYIQQHPLKKNGNG